MLVHVGAKLDQVHALIVRHQVDAAQTTGEHLGLGNNTRVVAPNVARERPREQSEELCLVGVLVRGTSRIVPRQPLLQQLGGDARNERLQQRDHMDDLRDW